MRTPAPVKLVVVPTRLVGRWALRRRAVKKAVKREVGVTQKRIKDELDRRLGPEDEATAAAVAEQAAPPVRLEAAQRWSYRHRRDILAPVAVALVLVCVRDVVHRFPTGWSWPALVLALGPVVSLLIAGVWWQAQIDAGNHAGHGRRTAARTTVALSLLWVADPLGFPVPVWPHHITLLPDLPTQMPGLRWVALIAATVMAAQFRWRRFQPRAEPAAPKVGPAEHWAATQGAEGRPLAGTSLSNVERVTNEDGKDVGWAAVVQCIDGQHRASKITANVEAIAGSYGREIKDVVVERTSNALRPRISVMERDPFRGARPWAGPSLTDDGISRIGSFFDGTPAMARLWKEGHGTFDTWCFGKKGSGKSTTIDNLLASWMSQGLVVGDLVDLKGGTSLPWWADQMFRYGTTKGDGMLALRRANAVLEARLAAMKEMTWFAPGDPTPRKGVSILPVSKEWPVHLTILEEGPQLLTEPEALPLLESTMTRARNANCPVMFVSQMAELNQAFNNSATIREQFQAGNVWAGYVGSTQGRLGLDGFKPDLSRIPKGSYLSYLTSEVQSREEALLRVDLIRDSWATARASVPGCSNPVDLAAIREVEEKAAQDDDGPAALRLVTGPAASTREAAEAAVKKLADAAGGPVTLGAIVAAIGDSEDKKLNDRVRKALGALESDPTSPVTKAGFGKWAA